MLISYLYLRYIILYGLLEERVLILRISMELRHVGVNGQAIVDILLVQILLKIILIKRAVVLSFGLELRQVFAERKTRLPSGGGIKTPLFNSIDLIY